ncbi:MAG: hypothetical protein J6Y74_01200 [Clostridia bacterium]|nr:hypothetical protein [Clostridia bacterium]
MKKRTEKLIAIVLILILCTLVGNLIVTQPILNRGIVIGMGVDKTEEDEIEVTVQIAVAGESSAPGAPNRYALVSGKGPTLLSAMDRIARITAYSPLIFIVICCFSARKSSAKGFSKRRRTFSSRTP